VDKIGVALIGIILVPQLLIKWYMFVLIKFDGYKDPYIPIELSPALCSQAHCADANAAAADTKA